jgi:hypothetical protein
LYAFIAAVPVAVVPEAAAGALAIVAVTVFPPPDTEVTTPGAFQSAALVTPTIFTASPTARPKEVAADIVTTGLRVVGRVRVVIATPVVSIFEEPVKAFQSTFSIAVTLVFFFGLIYVEKDISTGFNAVLNDL